MYALVQRVIGSAKPSVRRPLRQAKAASSKVRNVSQMGATTRVTRRFIGEVVKIEGQSAMLRKLEDPHFRKDFVANKPVPPGRSIWNDNPRLHIRLPSDPLPYVWPEGKDFASYDEVLKRSWEDEMFELKWFGKARGQVQGGDWAANRVSTDVPPRIKIYYAQMVDQFQQGNLLSATKAFNALITDFLAPVGDIPYGVYHTMLLIYKKREKFDRALQMFQEIVSHHTPTPDDYALGMEVLMAMNQPREALEVWDALRLRSSLKPNAFTYSTLMRAHAMLGDMDRVQEVFEYATKEIKSTPGAHGEADAVFNSLLSIYAELGYAPELEKLVETVSSSSPFSTITAALSALNEVGLFSKSVSSYSDWVLSKDVKFGISIYNTQIKAHAELGNIQALADLISQIESNGVPLDMASYTTLIAHRAKFGDKPRLQRLAEDGATLNTKLRPSIRNYRAAKTANILANSSDYALLQETMADLQSKQIEFDGPYFEAVALAHLQSNKLKEALELWQSEVAEKNLLPSRLSFTHLFNLAGTEKDHVSAAVMWKLSQELSIKPDFKFASALSLALQPDRNFFGLKSTRLAHTRWTSEPNSARVLNRQEVQEFSTFVNHVISTFSEDDEDALNKVWSQMYETVHASIEEEIVVEDRARTPMDPTPNFRARRDTPRTSIMDEADDLDDGAAPKVTAEAAAVIPEAAAAASAELAEEEAEEVPAAAAEKTA